MVKFLILKGMSVCDQFKKLQICAHQPEIGEYELQEDKTGFMKDTERLLHCTHLNQGTEGRKGFRRISVCECMEDGYIIFRNGGIYIFLI